MRRRTLGRTGLSVSELALGTVELGLDYGISTPGERLKPDRRKAAELLHRALDLGINLIDTARAYGDAEEIIGETLKDRRGEFVLVSKVGANPSAVRNLVEASLQALRTDYIDVMMIHCGVDADPDPETAGELGRLRDTGALRFLGASVYGERAALAAIDARWCDCIEIAYSALDRRPEAGTLARAAEHSIGVLARSVLLKGALTRRIQTLPVAFRPLQNAVGSLCDTASTDIDHLPEVAYRYVLMGELPHSLLVGSAHLAELEACVSYVERGGLDANTATRIRNLPILNAMWLNPGQWPSPCLTNSSFPSRTP
jgi:aryl-alcohol dehydrogenase-like predicted oxidoreductase